MSYISRLSLSAEASGAQRILRPMGDLYESHRLLWRFFGDSNARERDFLYRQEGEGADLHFLVVSAREPAPWSDQWRVETKAYDPKLGAGDILHFRVRVNPVVTRHDEAGKHKRHDVVMDLKRQRKLEGRWDPASGARYPEAIREAGAAWLSGRGERGGFTVDDASLRTERYEQHRFYRGKGTKPVTLSTLDFEGMLRVDDPDRFIPLLTDGLGPAKGMGCGLLLVRRAFS